MKNALLIDQTGRLIGVAASLLPPSSYKLTTVDAAPAALALLEKDSFELVLLEHADGCPGALWMLIETILQTSVCRPLVVILANAVSDEFYAQAQRVGAVLIGTPDGAQPMAEELERALSG